jgi:hypothetical protein
MLIGGRNWLKPYDDDPEAGQTRDHFFNVDSVPPG